jgi:hypothetical protein
MWDAAIAAPGWLALGVGLHLANQVLRGRGWHAIVQAAAGGGVRRRHTIAAWVAGAGAGGVLSARGGDAVRLLVLSRRCPRGGCPLLAGTLVAEGAGELAAGAALVALALALGVGPELGAGATTGFAALAAVLAALACWALVRRVPRLRRIAADIGRGCAPLRAPRAYARAVLPWQLASRACRLGALACFLAAFGLPATPIAVLLVTFAQLGGRLVPFAPASVGAGAAILAATLEPVSGGAVTVGQVAAFYVGTSVVLTAVGALLTTAICLHAVRWSGLAEAVRTLRRAAPARAPA